MLVSHFLQFEHSTVHVMLFTSVGIFTGTNSFLCLIALVNPNAARVFLTFRHDI